MWPIDVQVRAVLFSYLSGGFSSLHKVDNGLLGDVLTHSVHLAAIDDHQGWVLQHRHFIHQKVITLKVIVVEWPVGFDGQTHPENDPAGEVDDGGKNDEQSANTERTTVDYDKLKEKRSNEKRQQKEEEHGQNVGKIAVPGLAFILALQVLGSSVAVLSILLNAINVHCQTGQVQHQKVQEEDDGQLHQIERGRVSESNQQVSRVADKYFESHLESSIGDDTLQQVEEEVGREEQREALVGSPENGWIANSENEKSTDEIDKLERKVATLIEVEEHIRQRPGVTNEVLTEAGAFTEQWSVFTAVDYSQETEEIELSSIHLANKAVQVSFPNVG